MHDEEQWSQELRWTAAISRWLDGEPAELVAAIHDRELAMSSEARAFFADLATGQVKKPSGRPTEYEGWVERSIVAEVFTEWERLLAQPRVGRGGTPQDLAFAAVGEKRKTRSDAIRGVVKRLRRQGITLEFWQRIGRPNWKRT